MKKETKVVYQFDEREANLIKQCVAYCLHRKLEHNAKGLRFIKPENLECFYIDLKEL